MRLFLFTEKSTVVPEGVQNVTCSDPRVIRWLKTQNRIKKIPCLWVLGESIDSIYYGAAIDEYLSHLVESPKSNHLIEPLEFPTTTIPADQPLAELPLENEPIAAIDSSKKIFEPDYGDT